MENIIQTAEQLLNRNLTANDGYTSEEIKQAENMLGLTMPESLKLFYSLVGKVDVLTSSFQRFLPLDELQSDGDKIIFLAENQEVCLWATAILEYVQKEWNKVVQYNALIIFAYQDNLIWYFYKDDNTPTYDGIFLSCRTEEKFDKFSNLFDFAEL